VNRTIHFFTTGPTEQFDQGALSVCRKPILIDPQWDMIDLLVQARHFDSRGQAKKNGWKPEPIPKGITKLDVGKDSNGSRKAIFIFKE